MTIPHPALDGSATTDDPTSALTLWRVHETGRVAHRLVGDAAECGEPGNGWRVVAGVPQCHLCAQADSQGFEPPFPGPTSADELRVAS
jgi:hypothetical protein